MPLRCFTVPRLRAPWVCDLCILPGGHPEYGAPITKPPSRPPRHCECVTTKAYRHLIGNPCIAGRGVREPVQMVRAAMSRDCPVSDPVSTLLVLAPARDHSHRRPPPPPSGRPSAGQASRHLHVDYRLGGQQGKRGKALSRGGQV